ncbi:MAG: DUF6249 domain-containing protein [bacterium]
MFTVDVIAIFCVFLPIPIVIIWVLVAKFQRDHKNYRAKMDAVIKAVEAGRDLPEGFLVSEQPKKRLTLLEMGIIFIAIALALFIMMVTIFNSGISNAFGVCALPLLVGLAQVIIHFINVRNKK